MPAFQSVSTQQGIIAWWQNAGRDAAGLVVPIAILVRRSMEPMGRGVASNIGQPIPMLGVRATTITLSKVRVISVYRAQSERLEIRPTRSEP
jgi:hypothetical protein